MPKQLLGIRIEPEIKQHLDRIAKANDESLSKTIRRAIDAFLKGGTGRPTLSGMDKRLEALEAKVERLQGKPVGKVGRPRTEREQSRTDPDELGELITLQEAIELTGYAESTLQSNFSRKGVKAVKQQSGNRAGLYSKDEVLDKIGFKYMRYSRTE